MANLTVYNPLNEMVSLRQAMDRLFEESVISPRSNGFSGRQVVANLYETKEGFTLQLPMPGVKADDVEITIQQDLVSLKWAYKVEIPENAQVHWNGLQSGQYQQTFTIPAPLNADAAEANFRDGILTLYLPKAEHARARTIRVSTN